MKKGRPALRAGRPFSISRPRLASVVGVGLVGVGHLVHVLLPRDRSAGAVVGINQLFRETLRVLVTANPLTYATLVSE